MMKVMGIALVLITSSYAGFYFGEILKKRVDELKEIQRGIQQLQNEMMYTRGVLGEIFLEISKKSKIPLNLVFKEIADLLIDNAVDTVYEAFQSTLLSHKEKLNLTKEDQGIVLDFAKGLGECDIEGQVNSFSLVQENLKRQISLAECRKEKNTKLYRYSGFAFGAVIVLLLI